MEDIYKTRNKYTTIKLQVSTDQGCQNGFVKPFEKSSVVIIIGKGEVIFE